MSIVNVSLDTETRQMVLTINGSLVPFTEVDIHRFVGYDDGITYTNFSYTIEVENADGLKERRQLILPSEKELATEAHLELDDNNLLSKVVHDNEKAKADVIDFLKQRHNNQ